MDELLSFIENGGGGGTAATPRGSRKKKGKQSRRLSPSQVSGALLPSGAGRSPVRALWKARIDYAWPLHHQAHQTFQSSPEVTQCSVHARLTECRPGVDLAAIWPTNVVVHCRTLSTTVAHPCPARSTAPACEAVRVQSHLQCQTGLMMWTLLHPLPLQWPGSLLAPAMRRAPALVESREKMQPAASPRAKR